MTRFSFLSDDCGFLDVGQPLWPEDESVIYLYICFWALPEQSLSSWSPAELTTTFCCLNFWTPPTWWSRFPYLHRPGTGWLSYTLRVLGSLFDASYNPQGYFAVCACLCSPPNFSVFYANRLLSEKIRRLFLILASHLSPCPLSYLLFSALLTVSRIRLIILIKGARKLYDKRETHCP
jgi:hypothetical protein